MHPDVERLRAIPLFGSLSDAELERLSGWLEIRHAQPGERLTPEGAAGYTFFVIEDGSVEVQQESELIAALGPGDFFGEGAIIGSGRRNADVVATSPMTLFAMFGLGFREMVTSMPSIEAEIKQTYERRLAAGTD